MDMDSSDTSSSYNLVTKSLIDFINEHVPNSYLRSLDEIILNYVGTVLTTLGSESSEEFEVEEFKEMLSAYCPGFEAVPLEKVQQWVTQIVDLIKKRSDTSKNNEEKSFESYLTELESNIPVRHKKYSESSTESCSSTNTNSSIINKASSSYKSSRTPRISESNSATDEIQFDSDMNCIINRIQGCNYEKEENIDTLIEMFPTIKRDDAKHFLNTSNGNLEKAVQLLLSQIDNGQEFNSLKGTSKKNTGRSSFSTKTEEIKEKELKDRIVARYGFIDKAEDEREYRPSPPKPEPKKLVRYRESQVVSTKGERYSEVKCGANGGEIKNYIYKPPKPY